MTAMKRQSMSQKLIRFERLCLMLESLTSVTAKVFVLDEIRQAACERYLILGIEIIADVGNHLLLEKTSTPADSYERIIVELGRSGLVPKTLAEKNRKMAGFRNMLVHVYDVVEPMLVYRFAKKAPSVFRAFGKAFSKHLN